MAGFQWKHRAGSHNSFVNSDGRTVVIPDHGGQVIVRPLLRKIIRDMGLSIEQYNEMLDKR
jgi:predicted RNA binding protein YcfA (HicA-like mRNA interferase family)